MKVQRLTVETMFIEYNKDGEISLICSESVYKTLIELYLEDIEYNTDTSTHRPTCNDEDDDIVQTCIKMKCKN